jgi:hypothetical protein
MWDFDTFGIYCKCDQLHYKRLRGVAASALDDDDEVEDVATV